jgi:hypothetical protein
MVVSARLGRIGKALVVAGALAGVGGQAASRFSTHRAQQTATVKLDTADALSVLKRLGLSQCSLDSTHQELGKTVASVVLERDEKYKRLSVEQKAIAVQNLNAEITKKAGGNNSLRDSLSWFQKVSYDYFCYTTGKSGWVIPTIGRLPEFIDLSISPNDVQKVISDILGAVPKPVITSISPVQVQEGAQSVRMVIFVSNLPAIKDPNKIRIDLGGGITTIISAVDLLKVEEGKIFFEVSSVHTGIGSNSTVKRNVKITIEPDKDQSPIVVDELKEGLTISNPSPAKAAAPEKPAAPARPAAPVEPTPAGPIKVEEGPL